MKNVFKWYVGLCYRFRDIFLNTVDNIRGAITNFKNEIRPK